MKTRIGTLVVLIAALALVPAAQAAPTKVKVRVEGATKTLFEGAVTTDAHPVDGGDGSGPHACDGTNGGASTTPGPTATGALDDATKLGNLAWNGGFDPSFSDFVVSKIGPDASTSSQFWGVAVQWSPLQVGGCQYKVSRGEEILWAYDLFNKKHVLRLSGPRRIRYGKRFSVKVVDGQTNKPVAGAKVGGKKANAGGVARLRLRRVGTKRLKATEATSVRSNQIVVKVLPPKGK
jgi:hypothetical protein